MASFDPLPPYLNLDISANPASIIRLTTSHENLLLAILGDGEAGLGAGKASAVLNPTEFVNKMLRESPDRWISIQVFLDRGRIAFDAGDVTTRGGEIENSIHGVLGRFRKKKQVLTKGRRETRKFKLKP